MRLKVGQKRRRRRPVTGRSVDSLEAQKFKREVWSGSTSRVWLTKRVHQTWEISKRMSLFKTDNDFAGNGKGQAVVISMFFTNWLWINSRLPIPPDSTLMASLLTVSFSMFCIKLFGRIKQRDCEIYGV